MNRVSLIRVMESPCVGRSSSSPGTSGSRWHLDSPGQLSVNIYSLSVTFVHVCDIIHGSNTSGAAGGRGAAPPQEKMRERKKRQIRKERKERKKIEREKQ